MGYFCWVEFSNISRDEGLSSSNEDGYHHWLQFRPLISKWCSFAVLRTVIASTLSSYCSCWQVGISLFTRASTRPVTSTTFTTDTFSCVSHFCTNCSGLITNCMIPSRSRRTIKIKPPKSRRRLTHPFKVIRVPMCSSRTRPASLNVSFLINLKLIFFLLFYHKDQQRSGL